MSRFTLGQIVREARIQRGWTQAQLSMHSGIDVPRISKIENGNTSVFLSVKNWISLGQSLGIDSDWLLLASGCIPESYRQVVAVNAGEVLAFLKELKQERRTGA